MATDCIEASASGIWENNEDKVIFDQNVNKDIYFYKRLQYPLYSYIPKIQVITTKPRQQQVVSD